MTQRVRLRDEVFDIESTTAAGERTLYRLRSVDSGQSLVALCPPDIAEPIVGVPPDLDRRALSPFGLWQLRHQLLQLTSSWRGLAAIHGGRVQLEPYQLVPISQLLNDPRRSLLIADDVGLGKTVEAGLCLVELIARGIGQRILLVVPPGLIDQWIEEMHRKFGLAFKSIEDSASLDHAQTALAEGISPWAFHDRVITSTEYLKRPDVFGAALRRPWDVVVVDEAHYLAESGSPANRYSTRRTLLGVQLRKAARSLILLTATPHNGYRHSFRSLLELVEPAHASLAGSEARVHQRVSRSMVRRLKQQITRAGPNGQRLPAFVPRAPVVRLDVHCPTADERNVFELVTEYCARTAEAAATSDQRDLVSFAMQIVKKRMLSSRLALTRTVGHRLEALRQAPEDDGPSRAELRELQGDLPLSETLADRLVSRVLRSAVSKDAKRRAAEKRQLQTISRALERVEDRTDPKVARLLGHLHEAIGGPPGEKAIIFTEYRDTLEALRVALAGDDGFKNRYVELTGGLTARQRRDRIAAFAGPDCRVLLATDAASEGLNLQEHCHRLYHVELPWNPNRLEQRNGRIDRHGQRHSPQIGYLFYADSPEDRVLDRLVTRIVQMQDDRVSTPDIVGILEATRLPERLLAIAGQEDEANAAESLIRVFDEGRDAFLRDVAPLLAGRHGTLDASLDATSADPMLDDDPDFESAMLRLLGPHARSSGHPHEYRLSVPTALQGPGVAPEYPALTFRRSVALVDGRDATEFVHRWHPLARAASTHARDVITGASPGVTLPPCIAVRRLEGATTPGAIFTFLAGASHPSGALVAVGFHADGSVMPQPLVDRALLPADQPGDTAWDECATTFQASFSRLRNDAVGAAADVLLARTEEERDGRARLAADLRAEVEAYRSDRTDEISREEAAERAGARDQAELFRESATNWDARRAAVATHAEERLRIISEWLAVADPLKPEPLGVLFVFPGRDA